VVEELAEMEMRIYWNLLPTRLTSLTVLLTLPLE
jgi:hypothetical protein